MLLLCINVDDTALAPSRLLILIVANDVSVQSFKFYETVKFGFCTIYMTTSHMTHPVQHTHMYALRTFSAQSINQTDDVSSV